MKKKTITSIAASLLLGMGTVQTVQACSSSMETYFTFTTHPDFPLKKYAAGQLGILQNGYARSYLLPAYHYLSGAPLSTEEQEGLVELWDSRLNAREYGCSTDTSKWLKERMTVPGTAKIDNMETERPIGNEDSWETYCNCQTIAFETAATTLKNLIAKHGADSTAVKEWLNAQDQVFSNCGYASYNKPSPPVIPAALPESADKTLRQDRAYQIAAANFYSQNFEAARRDFESIASDTTSPWSQVSGYLAARAMIRQATLPKTPNKKLLEEAQEKLQKLASDPAYAGFSKDIAALSSYVAVRLDPAQHLHQLAKEKLSDASVAELTKTIDVLVGDDGSGDAAKLEYAKMPAAVKSPEEIDWIMTFQSSDKASDQHSIERWKKTHSLPWLVAAATAVDSDDPNADAIIAAADREQSGPAKWTLFYQSNRLNIGKGKNDLVRTRLDKVLNSPPSDLPVSSLNLLKSQRLPLAKNLDEFVRFGIQRPACNCDSGMTEQVPYDVDKLEEGNDSKPNSPVFTPEAADVMDNKLPLSLLIQLANNKNIPNDLRGHLAWTAWVRAVLIGDESAAKTLATAMKPFNKNRQKLVDAYLVAATPDARKFAAIFMMLQFSSAQPNVGYGPLLEDGFGDASGWWWFKSPIAKYDNEGATPAVETFDPLFVSSAQQAQARRELAALAKVKTAPDYFAQTVLSWAKAHPDDARVPESLYWLVKSTRYGSTDDATTALSKQAFQVLHTKYKTSPWTKKTPYWY